MHPCNQNLSLKGPRSLGLTMKLRRTSGLTGCREKLWRKYHTPELWRAFQVARRSYHDKIKSCKTSTISTQVLECGKDSKKLFELVSKLTGSKATNPMSDNEDTQQLTEEFADHFQNKIVRICDALDG